MNDVTDDQKKRGDLQLVALDIINAINEDYTFEELVQSVGTACFPDHPEADPKARHLIRYMVRNQDRITVGKKVTLREQGRIVAPSWYTPVAVNPNCPKDDPRYLEHMAAGIEMQSNPPARPVDSVTYLDFPLKAPSGRKKPVARVKETKTLEETLEERGTPERLNLIKEVARNFKAKSATARMKELAAQGAQQFASPTVIAQTEKTEAPAVAEAPVLEGEGV